MNHINVIFLGIVMTLFGCSKPTYLPKQLVAEEKTSSLQAETISSKQSQIDQTLKLFLSALEKYEKDDFIPKLDSIYAEDAFLNDRIHTVKGLENIKAYFTATFDKIVDCEFIFHDKLIGQTSIVVTWTMRIQTKKDQPYMEFLGSSQLRFNKEGKIFYHQDYWDFSELLSEIRGASFIINYAKNKA